MKKLLLYILFTLSIQISVAQPYDGACSMYSINDGLSNNLINDITTDNDGLIWIATNNGLSRFDGKHFVNFNHPNYPHLFKDGKIDGFYNDGQYIYLISNQYGLVKLNPTEIAFETIYTKGVVSMFLKGDTAAYLFRNGELNVYIKNKLISKRQFSYTPKASLVINYGKIYVCAANIGLLELNPLTLTTNYKFILDTVDNNNFKINFSNKYGITYNSGYKIFTIDKNHKFKIHPLLGNSNPITFYTEDYKNMPNYVIQNKLPHVYLDTNATAFVANCVQNGQIRTILRVTENCFFIGTNQGLMKIDRLIKVNTVIDDNPLYDIKTIRVRRKIIENKKNHDLYLLGFPGLIRFNKDFKLITTKKISTYDGIVFGDKLYCTTEGLGVISYSLLSNELGQHPVQEIDNEYFFTVTPYNDSVLIFGGVDKVVLFNTKNKSYKRFFLKEGADVYKIEKNEIKNNYLLATDKGLLNVSIDYNKGIIYAKNQSNYKDIVKDILKLPKRNEVWLATDEGVVVLNKTTLQIIKKYSQPHEISNPKVTALVLDNDENVWASTYSGLTVFNLKKDYIYFVSKKQKLQNTEYNYNSATKLDNGKLMFGGLNAYDLVTPNSIKSLSFKKDFFISGIDIIDQNKKTTFTYKSKDTLDFLPFKCDEEELNVYLATLDYTSISGYKFEYQINHGEWIFIPNNIIRISNLPYGHHKVSIRMYNPLDIISSEKTFYILAYVPFYKKTSFFVVMFIIVTLLCILLIFYYTRSVKIEKETKHKIAMDLHDEAGTILTRMSLLLNKKNINEEKSQLDSGLKEVLFSFRSFMSSMSKEQVTVQDLEDEIREFLQKTLQNSTILGTVESSKDKNYTLKGELYRDIKLCIYEILNNSIKYSNCTTFTLDMIAKDRTLKLRLIDNGDLSHISQLDSRGNGIKNIKKRAIRNQGFCNMVVPLNTTGLLIELKFPIK